MCGLQKNDGILLGKKYDTNGMKIVIGKTGNLNQGECQGTECVVPASIHINT